jgi:hypothetical protein
MSDKLLSDGQLLGAIFTGLMAVGSGISAGIGHLQRLRLQSLNSACPIMVRG